MTEGALKHTRLDGIFEYAAALDTLCQQARHSLLLFDKNFDGFGYNSEARFTTLHNFLLASPANRLLVLAHDMSYLSTRCPRMLMLLHQFGTSMFTRQTPKHLRDISEPFSVADGECYVRRFHFDGPQGILAQHDPAQAGVLTSRFLDMWNASLPSQATSRVVL
jgi:hypothetical protein